MGKDGLLNKAILHYGAPYLFCTNERKTQQRNLVLVREQELDILNFTCDPCSTPTD